MHNGGKTVGNEYGDLILLGGNLPDGTGNFFFGKGI